MKFYVYRKGLIIALYLIIIGNIFLMYFYILYLENLLLKIIMCIFTCIMVLVLGKELFFGAYSYKFLINDNGVEFYKKEKNLHFRME